MPTVLLVRHGQNQYVSKGRLAGRLPGVHLNDKGKDIDTINSRVTFSMTQRIPSWVTFLYDLTGPPY